MSEVKRKLEDGEARRPSVFSRHRRRRERPSGGHLTLYEPVRQEESEEATPEPGGVRAAAEEKDVPLARLLNVLVAAGALVVLSPVILLIAIAIRLESDGPILYRQLRVGLDARDGEERRSRDGDDGAPPEVDDRRSESDRRGEDLGGRPFFIYKFRTMEVDAESETGPTWCHGSQDRRTTRVGRFLRKHRLDEIPQFWNVLKGEMSVVGPRPERPVFFHELRREILDYPVRQKVLPGITGWAQVNRGYDQSVDDVHRKLIYDLEYIRRRSLWFDLRIMFETILVMAGRQKPFSDLGSGVA